MASRTKFHDDMSAGVPRFYRRLFEWFCDPDAYEELQGDLEEAFAENTVKLGSGKAKARYRREVIKMIRPSVIRNLRPHPIFNPFVMLSNYFKTSTRALLKKPMTAFINVFGLSMAIGICLIGYAFLEWEYNLDQFHENKHEVYLATLFSD